MNLSFQICAINDLEILSKISRDTFVDAFETFNDPKDFRKYINEAFSKSTIQSELKNPNSTFYFVYLDTELVGYFKLNVKKAQSEYIDVNGMELERIYVLSAQQNKGLGALILENIISIANSKKQTPLWLGVWQKNEAAVRFYERYGFVKFDTHPYYIGQDKQTDWLMKLDFL